MVVEEYSMYLVVDEGDLKNNYLWRGGEYLGLDQGINLSDKYKKRFDFYRHYLRDLTNKGIKSFEKIEETDVRYHLYYNKVPKDMRKE